MAHLRLLYDCDHVVVDRSFKTATVNMVRGYRGNGIFVGGNVDTIETVSAVYAVDKIVYRPTPQEEVILSPEIYNLYTDRIIWLVTPTPAVQGVYRIPQIGDAYEVTVKHTLYSVTKYDLRDCLRCRGTGWYVNPLTGSGLASASGALLVAQEFIKCLLTIPGTDPLSDAYGAGLLMDNKVSYIDGDLHGHIRNAVKSAEMQCIRNTSLELRDADEILDRVIIESIEDDYTMPGVSVILTLFTLQGSQIRFNLNV